MDDRERDVEREPAERVEHAADRIEEAAEELSRTTERVEKVFGETKKATDYSQLAGDDVIPPGDESDDSD